jgi:FG-GAP-like repeat
MSAKQKKNLRQLKQKASLLNRLLGSGAFSHMPAVVQRGWVRTMRHLYRSLAGVVPEATLRSILASAAALVIGMSAACSDDTTPTLDAIVADDGAVVEWQVDVGVDQGFDTMPADAGVEMAPADAGPEVAPTDIGPEVAPADNGPDVAPADVGPDVAPADVGPDVAPADVGPDVAPADAGPDVALDAALDAAVDAPTSDASVKKNAFKAAVADPWSFTKTTGYYYYYNPALADLDGDGDLDLLIGSYGYPGYSAGVYYYKNTGTAKAPALAAPVGNVFTVAPSTYYETAAAVVDIDDDGDLDMFAFGGFNADLFFYKNNGTKTAPTFAAQVSNPFGLTISSSAWSTVAPNFVDIDGDGDLDLFTVEVASTAANSTLQFFENTGTAKAPAFSAAKSAQFGLPANLSSAFAFVDLDGDGDLDLLASPAGGTSFSYYKNTGTAKAPVFAAPVANPFSLVASGKSGPTSLVVGDIDGDGDLDIIQGYADGILFFENTKY